MPLIFRHVALFFPAALRAHRPRPRPAVPQFVSLLWFLVLAQSVLVSHVVVEEISGALSHDFFLALHRAEEEGLHRHEALAHQALGAAGALEAVGGGVPVVVAVGNPLVLGFDRFLTGGAHCSVVLHVARFADGLVVLHDVRLSSQDAVTVEAAEVLQVPVLSLSLSVLVTEDQLIAACTSWLLAVSVMASTVQLPFLPEVDHVHQQLIAGTAHETRWVPQLVVAGALGVDGRFTATHRLLAVTARKVLL